MKAITTIALTLIGLNIANAQWRPDPDVTVIGSVSGQFFVSARGSVSPHSRDLAAGPDMVTLQPALLAVSCERIKQGLFRQLNLPDQWRGKIFITLRPARSAEDAIYVYPKKLGNWDCAIEMPDAVGRSRFVESVVRACLLEIANRNATTRSAEIPEWLVRGFTRQLMASSEIKLILPPPHTDENGMNATRAIMDFSDAPSATGSRIHRMNPLAEAADILRTNASLTFDDLSWPTDEQLTGSGADVFGSSAQLLVSQLLRMPKGPACLRTMLEELPDYLNWQLAFLGAFHETFEQALDVEKWWALELTQFTDRDLMHLLTPEESSRQLDAVFQFPIDVRIGVAPPMRTDINFQTIIRGWSRPRQLQTLKEKIWELGLLRMRISPEFVPLLDQYRQVLQDYYKKRSVSTRLLANLGIISDHSVQEAIQRLDALDVQRANLRPQRQVPLAASAETAPLP